MSRSPFIFFSARYVLYDENNAIIPDTHDVYKILKSVVIPGHLKNVKFRVQDFSTCQDGLIFTGVDSRDRVQYYYGKNHVMQRRDSRLDTILNVQENIKALREYIKTHYTLKNAITKDYLFSVLLQLELTFFIRLGKEKYLKENGTTGISTLKCQNVTETDDALLFTFVGKTSVTQEFKIQKTTELARHIKRLIAKNSDFLFTDQRGTKLSEGFIYSKMSEFNVKLKDLRTYGANETFCILNS